MTATSEIAAEARRLLHLAWPVVLTGLNWTILHVTDIVVVGQAGTVEVAAFGASRAITYITIVAGLSALSGILVFAARADGAGELAETGAVLRRGVLLGLALGLVTAAILLAFAVELIAGIGVSPDLVPKAAQVVQVMALSYPASFVLIAASYYLEGISRPRPVMVVNLSILPVNALLAWALSGGHLGLPALGASGAGLATTIAAWLGMALMLRATWREGDAAQRGVRDLSAAAWLAAASGLGALARFGIVPALAAMLEMGGFSWLIALSTEFGPVTAHAFQIVFSLHNVTFALALGLGSAAGVRVGNAVGAGEIGAARDRTTIAAGMALVLTGAAAIVLMVAGGGIVGLFPADRAVHLAAAAMLLVWAPFVLFDGLQVVFTYALRSLGDQVVAGVNTIIAFFLVTGGLGWWLVRSGWGPMALVWASGLGMVAAAVLQGLRLVAVTAPSRLQSSG